MATFVSYGVSSERLGGLSRARSAMRDNFGRFLPACGFFSFEQVRERFCFACGGCFSG